MFKEGLMTGDQVFVEWLGNFADVKGDGRILKSVLFPTSNLFNGFQRNGMITMQRFPLASKTMSTSSNL